MQVEVTFSFIYICAQITDFHVPFFSSSSSFMFPVAGGLGPPQGMCELKVVSTDFITLFRYINQLQGTST